MRLSILAACLAVLAFIGKLKGSKISSYGILSVGVGYVILTENSENHEDKQNGLFDHGMVWNQIINLNLNLNLC